MSARALALSLGGPAALGLFFLFPLIVRSGDAFSDSSMLLAYAFALDPLACAVVGFVAGALDRRSWALAPLTALAWLPAAFLVYNDTALYLAPILGVLTLIGWLIGLLFPGVIAEIVELARVPAGPVTSQ